MINREQIARVLHEAHKPFCDYTYDFEDPMSSRHVYEALADAVLNYIAVADTAMTATEDAHTKASRDPSVGKHD